MCLKSQNEIHEYDDMLHIKSDIIDKTNIRGQ